MCNKFHNLASMWHPQHSEWIMIGAATLGLVLALEAMVIVRWFMGLPPMPFLD